MKNLLLIENFSKEYHEIHNIKTFYIFSKKTTLKTHIGSNETLHVLEKRISSNERAKLPNFRCFSRNFPRSAVRSRQFSHRHRFLEPIEAFQEQFQPFWHVFSSTVRYRVCYASRGSHLYVNARFIFPAFFSVVLGVRLLLGCFFEIAICRIFLDGEDMREISHKNSDNFRLKSDYASKKIYIDFFVVDECFVKVNFFWNSCNNNNNQ